MSNKQYAWYLSIKLWLTTKNNCSSLYYFEGITKTSMINNMWKRIPNVKMGFFIWQLHGFSKGHDLLNRVNFSSSMYGTDLYMMLIKKLPTQCFQTSLMLLSLPSPHPMFKPPSTPNLTFLPTIFFSPLYYLYSTIP